MTRLLAILRRLFLGGFVTLFICIAIQQFEYSSFFATIFPYNGTITVFKLYLLSAPLLYITLLIISVLFIRQRGQFAVIHKNKAFALTLIRCFGADLISPFKNIKNFLCVLFSKQVIGRTIIIIRFFELLILTAFSTFIAITIL